MTANMVLHLTNKTNRTLGRVDDPIVASPSADNRTPVALILQLLCCMLFWELLLPSYLVVLVEEELGSRKVSC